MNGVAWHGRTKKAFCPKCAKMQRISVDNYGDGRVAPCSNCDTVVWSWRLNPETEALELDHDARSNLAKLTFAIIEYSNSRTLSFGPGYGTDHRGRPNAASAA